MLATNEAFKFRVETDRHYGDGGEEKASEESSGPEEKERQRKKNEAKQPSDYRQ